MHWLLILLLQRPATPYLSPLIEPIQRRPWCRVLSILVTPVHRDTARIQATIWPMAEGGVFVRDGKVPLAVDFTYVRDSIGWRRLPLTRRPTRDHAPCYVDQEWQRLPLASPEQRPVEP